MSELILCRRYVDGVIAHPVTGEPVVPDNPGRGVACHHCGRTIWYSDANGDENVPICEAHLDDVEMDDWPALRARLLSQPPTGSSDV